MRRFRLGLDESLSSDADRLSRDAQHGLRRTMERYQATCRIMLMCETPAYIIEPLKSRCLFMRIPRPDDRRLRAVLAPMASALSSGRDGVLDRVVSTARGNIRTAVMCLQAFVVHAADDMVPTDNMLQDWSGYIEEHLVAPLTSPPVDPADLPGLRSRLYDMVRRDGRSPVRECPTDH